MGLYEYHTDRLEAELKKRKKQKETKPKPLENPDFSTLIKYCLKYLEPDNIRDLDRSMKEDIFEEALIAVFGDDVYHWIHNN